MKINLTFTVDAWKRVTVSAVFTWSEPAHLLAFIEHGPDMWWAKSPVAKTELAYSAHYHHVRHQQGQRQVIVSCGATIQDCVIPEGFDPGAPAEIQIEPLRPSTLYAQHPHRLGLILVPKSATKSLRNRIWRLKPALLSPALAPFAEALARGRSGHLRSETYSVMSQPSEVETNGHAPPYINFTWQHRRRARMVCASCI